MKTKVELILYYPLYLVLTTSCYYVLRSTPGNRWIPSIYPVNTFGEHCTFHAVKLSNHVTSEPLFVTLIMEPDTSWERESDGTSLHCLSYTRLVLGLFRVGQW